MSKFGSTSQIGEAVQAQYRGKERQPNSFKFDPKLLYMSDIAATQKSTSQDKSRAGFGGLIAGNVRESRKTAGNGRKREVNGKQSQAKIQLKHADTAPSACCNQPVPSVLSPAEPGGLNRPTQGANAIWLTKQF